MRTLRGLLLLSAMAAATSLGACGGGLDGDDVGEATLGNAVVNERSSALVSSVEWTRLGATGPAGRYGYGMAFDSARGVPVLFGGIVESGEPDETWILSGGAWNRRGAGGGFPSVDPGPKRYPRTAFDRARGVLVVHGGDNGAGPTNETWEWDGAAWANRAVGRPFYGVARSGFAMAFDPVRNVTVVHGGRDANGLLLMDIWEYDGRSWRQRPFQPLTWREGHAMAYDEARRTMVIFGGANDTLSGGRIVSQMLNDWAEYDGQTWRAGQANIGAPAPRRNHAMAYLPCAQSVVVFGGETAPDVPTNDVWGFDGTHWTNLTPVMWAGSTPVVGSPTGNRHSMSLAKESATSDRLVLFGGRTRNPPTTGASGFSADTWALSCVAPPVVTPPIANAQTVVGREDTALPVVLTGRVAPGRTARFRVATLPRFGTVSGVAPNLSYRPSTNWNGNDAFTFEVGDGIAWSAPATVSIRIAAVNDAPVARSKTVLMLMNTIIAIPLEGTDADGDPLTFRVTSRPRRGTLTLLSNNRVVYKPNRYFVGTDSFTYIAADGSQSSAPATVTLRVDRLVGRIPLRTR